MVSQPGQYPLFGPVTRASAVFWLFVAIVVWTITLLIPVTALNFFVLLIATLPLFVFSNGPLFWIALTLGGLCFCTAIFRAFVSHERSTIWWTLGTNFIGLAIVLVPYRLEIIERVVG